MSKPLFDNVGKELKNIAELVALWVLIGYIGVGLVVAIAGIAYAVEWDEPGVAVLSVIGAIIIIIFGRIKSRLQVIMLYAKGELVEKTTSIDNKLSKTRGNSTKEHNKVAVKRQEDDKGAPVVSKNTDGSWECAFCDHSNPAGADWCEECGIQAKFK